MKDYSSRVALIAKVTEMLPRGRGAIPRVVGKLFRRLFEDCYVLTRHGIKLVVTPLALDSFTTMAHNCWAIDYWVLDTCADLLPENGVFYDVGANIGYMSLEMTRLKSNYQYIVSFEPQSDLLKNLRRSCKLNNIERISLYEACVGEASGDVAFLREAHSVHSHVDYSTSDRNGGTANERVWQVALDDLVDQGEILPPDVIKIDVEGYEYAVLQGACSVIENFQPHIVFELSDSTLKFGHRPIDYFNLLANLGKYNFEIAVGSYRKPVRIVDLEEFDQNFVYRPGLTNILARAEARQVAR